MAKSEPKGCSPLVWLAILVAVIVAVIAISTVGLNHNQIH